MSSGIRAAIEIRRSIPGSSAGWWLAADNVYVDEPPNRLLFAILAGKPTIFGVEPVAPLRGLPGDVTTNVRASYDEWGSAATEVSWVTHSELLAAVRGVQAAIHSTTASEHQKEQFRANQIGASIQAVLSCLSVYETHGYDARLIFWFTPI